MCEVLLLYVFKVTFILRSPVDNTKYRYSVETLFGRDYNKVFDLAKSNLPVGTYSFFFENILPGMRVLC